MTQHIKTLVSGVILSAAVFNTAAHAEVQRGLLISVGQASQSMDNLQNELSAKSYTNLSTESDEKEVAWSLGYRHAITQSWSADIQYLQQGKVEPVVEAILPLGKTTQQAAEDATAAMPERGQGLSAVALYHHPLSHRLTLQAGVGAFVWQSKRTATAGSVSHTRKTDGVSPIVQLGVALPLSKGVQLEAHLQRILMPDEPVDRLGLGLVVSF